MFDRYNEQARRVIFFARYEASQCGASSIDCEHILLGIWREAPELVQRFFPNPDEAEHIRGELYPEGFAGPKVSTSVDMPLSNDAQRILAYAEEEAQRLAHDRIGPEHVFLGVLREEKSKAAEILHSHGMRVSAVREVVHSGTVSPKTEASAEEAIRRMDHFLISENIGNAQVFIKRWIEFQNEADGTVLGRTPALDVPQVGHEIAIGDMRGRVKTVVHYYENSSGRQELVPRKIVVYVEVLPKR